MDGQWAQDACSRDNVESFLPRTFQAPCLTRCSPLSEAAKRPLFSPLGDITVSLSTHGGRPFVQWLGSQKFFPLDMDWDGKGLDTVGETNVGERSQEKRQKPALSTQRRWFIPQDFIFELLGRAQQSAPCAILTSAVPLVTASLHPTVTHAQGLHGNDSSQFFPPLNCYNL